MPSSAEIAETLLEVASEQRLNAILILNKEKLNLAAIAKRLDTTASEIHRNLGRLQKKGLIKKSADGKYQVTLFGQIICSHIPSISLMFDNKKYFDSHSIADLPVKFIQRIGALADSEFINGYVNVMDRWESVYKNAKKYIHNFLIETPYNKSLLETLESKMDNKIKIASIFSDSAVISKERSRLLAQFDFSKFIAEGTLQRKTKKGLKIALVINEREAGISFPSREGEPDLSKMLYSSDPLFHEWCLDLFNESWKTGSAFQEAKISHQS